jgi:potassium channel subfamily K
MGNEDDPTDFPGQEQPDIMVPPPMRAPKGLHADSAADEEQERDEKEFSSSEGAADGRIPSVDGNVDRKTSVARNMEARRKNRKDHRRNQSDQDSDYLLDWSWLSNASPLMSEKSEAEWILDRLSAALERELNRQRKGLRRKPPISLRDARKPSENKEGRTAETEARSKEERNLETAARSE